MKVFNNKNAFQEDAYRLLVDHGGVHGACLDMCVSSGCVYGVCPHPPDPEADPPGPRGRHPPMDRQTPVITLPCPKLRLRMVIRISFSQSHVHIRKPKSVTCAITHLNVTSIAFLHDTWVKVGILISMVTIMINFRVGHAEMSCPFLVTIMCTGKWWCIRMLHWFQNYLWKNDSLSSSLWICCLYFHGEISLLFHSHKIWRSTLTYINYHTNLSGAVFDDDYYCRKKNFLRKILQEKLLLKVYEETTAVFGEFFSCWKIAFDSSDPYLLFITLTE